MIRVGRLLRIPSLMLLLLGLVALVPTVVGWTTTSTTATARNSFVPYITPKFPTTRASPSLTVLCDQVRSPTWTCSEIHTHAAASQQQQQQDAPPDAVPAVEDNNDTTVSKTLTPAAAAATTRASWTATWMDRANQLREYRLQHGNTLVPKRYKANPALGNWVNKQRQHYRKLCLPDKQPCSLTQERVDILNQLGFCWDASNVTSAATATTAAATATGSELSSPSVASTGSHNDKLWWNRLEDLQHYLADHNITSLVQLHQTSDAATSRSSLTAWMRQQRKDLQKNRLSLQQTRALDATDGDWQKSRRQWQWDVRFAQLEQYQQAYGDCCVPISFADKALANWVSNQRKQYNLRLAHGASDLTDERLQRLEQIGFVWNRWEYEFEKKQDTWKWNDSNDSGNGNNNNTDYY